MPALDLWNLASQLKSTDYRWVDLTHTLSCDTPHWFGFKPFESTKLFDYLPGTPEDMLAPHALLPVFGRLAVRHPRRRAAPLPC